MRSAPKTFERKRDAEQWLTLLESQILRGEWHAPETGKVQLDVYATAWLADRPLQPRSRELYASLLRNHVIPFLGGRSLDAITAAAVRNWRTHLLGSGRSEATAAKAYRLLRAILNTAVREDRLIRENPCRIKGYDKEPTPERPIASVEQVFRLSDAMPARYAALVTFAAFTGLRWGELVALRRCDLDLRSCSVRVSRTFAELQDGRRVPGPPKSAAGFRTVAFPSTPAPILDAHLEANSGSEPDALVFHRAARCSAAAQQLPSFGALGGACS